MAVINATGLRKYFIKNDKIDNIKYIKGDKKVRRHLKKFLKNQEKINTEELSQKENYKLNLELKEISLELWKNLLINAFYFIGFDERIGVEKLYEYLQDFRNFEEILYGTNPYYRDHTCHCLNLYLMGEYLFRKNGFYNRLRMYTPANVISLTHDLGYPIEILNSMNQKILQMYSHYKNIKFNELSLEFPIAYQGIFNYLIDILSLTQTPKCNKSGYVRDPKEKRYIKLEKPPEIMQNLRSQVSKALIDYDHGIISCFKLIENLFLFRDDYGISLSNLNKLKMDEGSLKMDEGSLKIDERFLISQEILKTIRYHSTTDTRISDAYLIYLWFNILDDICEWSRYTKAEGYCNVPGFCEVEVEAFSLKKVEVKFSYADYPKNYKPYLQYDSLMKNYFLLNC